MDEIATLLFLLVVLLVGFVFTLGALINTAFDKAMAKAGLAEDKKRLQTVNRPRMRAGDITTESKS